MRIGLIAAGCAISIVCGSALAREMPLPRWDWVIGGPVDVDTLVSRRLDFVGLDAFEVSAETVAALQTAGIQVWCYISAGTIEDWRPDYDMFLAADATAVAAGGEPLIGAPYGEWPGEHWLNPRARAALMPLIDARLAMCAVKGFDLVEFDNMDGFDNETGLDITADEQIAFARALADAAGRHGLGAVLKNTPDLVEQLEPWFDAYLMEDCVLSGTCGSGAPFLAANKPVLNAEYPEVYADDSIAFDLDHACLTGEGDGVAMLIKPLDLTMETTLCP